MKTKNANETRTKLASTKSGQVTRKKPVARKTVKKTATVVTERHIPARAGAALVAASRRAKKARLSTMMVSDNRLVLVTPDGNRTSVKTIAPGVKVSIGTRITLR